MAHLRKHLPSTFFNLTLSPVEISEMSVEEIHETIGKLLADSADASLSGICCINMDDKVSDDQIDAIFKAVH